MKLAHTVEDCPECGHEANVLSAPTPSGSKVYWCVHGHVIVMPDTNHRAVTVFDFHEDVP